MTITIELDRKTEKALTDYAAKNEISISEAIARGLQMLSAAAKPTKSSCEAGKLLFGRYASGRTDGSENVKQHFRDTVRAKYARDCNVLD